MSLRDLMSILRQFLSLCLAFVLSIQTVVGHAQGLRNQVESTRPSATTITDIDHELLDQEELEGFFAGWAPLLWDEVFFIKEVLRNRALFSYYEDLANQSDLLKKNASVGRQFLDAYDSMMTETFGELSILLVNPELYFLYFLERSRTGNKTESEKKKLKPWEIENLVRASLPGEFIDTDVQTIDRIANLPASSFLVGARSPFPSGSNLDQIFRLSQRQDYHQAYKEKSRWQGALRSYWKNRIFFEASQDEIVLKKPIDVKYWLTSVTENLNQLRLRNLIVLRGQRQVSFRIKGRSLKEGLINKGPIPVTSFLEAITKVEPAPGRSDSIEINLETAGDSHLRRATKQWAAKLDKIGLEAKLYDRPAVVGNVSPSVRVTLDLHRLPAHVREFFPYGQLECDQSHFSELLLSALPDQMWTLSDDAIRSAKDRFLEEVAERDAWINEIQTSLLELSSKALSEEYVREWIESRPSYSRKNAQIQRANRSNGSTFFNSLHAVEMGEAWRNSILVGLRFWLLQPHRRWSDFRFKLAASLNRFHYSVPKENRIGEPLVSPSEVPAARFSERFQRANTFERFALLVKYKLGLLSNPSESLALKHVKELLNVSVAVFLGVVALLGYAVVHVSDAITNQRPSSFSSDSTSKNDGKKVGVQEQWMPTLIDEISNVSGEEENAGSTDVKEQPLFQVIAYGAPYPNFYLYPTANAIQKAHSLPPINEDRTSSNPHFESTAQGLSIQLKRKVRVTAAIVPLPRPLDFVISSIVIDGSHGRYSWRSDAPGTNIQILEDPQLQLYARLIGSNTQFASYTINYTYVGPPVTPYEWTNLDKQVLSRLNSELLDQGYIELSQNLENKQSEMANLNLWDLKQTFQNSAIYSSRSPRWWLLPSFSPLGENRKYLHDGILYYDCDVAAAGFNAYVKEYFKGVGLEDLFEFNIASGFAVKSDPEEVYNDPHGVSLITKTNDQNVYAALDVTPWKKDPDNALPNSPLSLTDLNVSPNQGAGEAQEKKMEKRQEQARNAGPENEGRESPATPPPREALFLANRPRVTDFIRYRLPYPLQPRYFERLEDVEAALDIEPDPPRGTPWEDFADQEDPEDLENLVKEGHPEQPSTMAEMASERARRVSLEPWSDPLKADESITPDKIQGYFGRKIDREYHKGRTQRFKPLAEAMIRILKEYEVEKPERLPGWRPLYLLYLLEEHVAHRLSLIELVQQIDSRFGLVPENELEPWVRLYRQIELVEVRFAREFNSLRAMLEKENYPNLMVLTDRRYFSAAKEAFQFAKQTDWMPPHPLWFTDKCSEALRR